MKRVTAFVHLAIALIASAAAASNRVLAPDTAQQPNIILIVTDDQRADMLGCITPTLHTPAMDALAARGHTFHNAFVTTPICAASRASILTGLVEHTHGYTFGTPPLAPRFIRNSYPALLRTAGYRTGFIGKFGINTHDDATATLFDSFQPLSPPYLKAQQDGSTRHLTDITADRAITFLESHENPDQPFCLTVSFNAPHAEDNNPKQYISPETTAHLYTDLNIPPPPLSGEMFFQSQPEFLKQSLNRIRWRWRFDTPQKYQTMVAGYMRMISGVDAAIARILEALETNDLTDNTVIIFTSDNGYFLGERGYAGKWLPYDQSIRVPLIIYDPRLPDSQRAQSSHAIALNIDIPATILDLAGIAPPPTMQGETLLPFITGRHPESWRDDFFCEHRFNHAQIPKHETVRNKRFRYSRYVEQQPIYEELFDLLNDPLETINLAHHPDHTDTLQHLRDRCNVYLAHYADPATPLFNGRDLTGWHAVGGGTWQVHNNAILGTATKDERAHGLLISDETYTDFIVSFDYRITTGDSGFYFRAEKSHDAVGVHGFQVEVDNTEPGGLYETAGRAWVIKPTPEQAATWHRPGEWNHIELTAHGGDIRVTVNGIETATLEDDPGRLAGHFALQLHGGQDMHVEYRDIVVRSIQE